MFTKADKSVRKQLLSSHLSLKFAHSYFNNIKQIKFSFWKFFSAFMKTAWLSLIIIKLSLF